MLGARIDRPEGRRTLDGLVAGLWRADRWLIYVLVGGAVAEWIR